MPPFQGVDELAAGSKPSLSCSGTTPCGLSAAPGPGGIVGAY